MVDATSKAEPRIVRIILRIVNLFQARRRETKGLSHLDALFSK